MGKCPKCGEWGSLVETKRETSRLKTQRRQTTSQRPLRLSEVQTRLARQIATGMGEFDRVLGGGIVPGSVILLAGEPGVGKSTLLTQVAHRLGGFYVSGEESPQQIKLRTKRLGIKTGNLFLLAETNVENIIATLEAEIREQKEKHQLLVIDSIQTMYTYDLTGTSGSVGQVRESAAKLLNYAKKANIPMFLVGHITKAGAIAGPKVLEHLVDTVLYFEGERFKDLRLLRAYKNRFGPTDEVGVFKMTDKGMDEVEDPSGLFLGKDTSEAEKSKIGSAIVCVMEGTRPMLVEIQALVVPSSLAVTRRVANGINYNRLLMLTAVLQKLLRLSLYQHDIYVNVAGGLKVVEPAVDLGVCLAIISSFKNKPLPSGSCLVGEIGLLGEIRAVAALEKREKEAKRLGFSRIISAKNYSSLPRAASILEHK